MTNIANQDGFLPIHYVENDEILALFLKRDVKIINKKTSTGLTLLDIIEKKLENATCSRRKIQQLEWCLKLLKSKKAKHGSEL